MKYLLPVNYYNYNLKQQNNTFLKHRKLKKDEISLYNKNSNSFSYWKIIGRSQTHFAFIVERYYCPKYFKNVLNRPNL